MIGSNWRLRLQVADTVPEGDLSSNDFLIIEESVKSVNRSDDREVLGGRKDLDLVDEGEGDGRRDMHGQVVLHNLTNQPVNGNANLKVKAAILSSNQIYLRKMIEMGS